MNIKSKLAFAGAVVSFAAVIYRVNELTALWAILPFVLGVICFAGVFALGLPQSQDPDNATR